MSEVVQPAPAREPRRSQSSSHDLEEKAPAEQRGYEEKENVEDPPRHHDHHDDEKLVVDMNAVDPFPVDPDVPEETHQLTIRALVVGGALGAVVGASNIYLGLKTGFTFGPQLFGAIFGFAIIKPISKALPDSGILGKLFGGHFGPKENCTVQTAATSAGGLGILFVSAVPAMYRMELLSHLPQDDLGRLFALNVASAFFGVFFVIPLRKYFILRQKLVFPTPTATAFTIRSLHSGRHGAEAARKKAWALLISMVIVFIFKVCTGYAPGLLYDWHFGWTFYRLGWEGMLEFENLGWVWENTPAFIGAGMLSGVNASWSFFGGAILAWGIIAPSILKAGYAVGVEYDPEVWPGWKSYLSMSVKSPELYITQPSPRYWLLWPGVLVMLVYSFAEIGMSSRSLLSGLSTIPAAVKESWRRYRAGEPPEDDDPAPPEDRVPLSWWTGGLLISIIMCCALLATQFGIGVGESILALLLGFLFSFIGVQSAGDTDINPVSTVAKASQLVFGGVSKGQGVEIKQAQLMNLVAGTVAAGSAAQGTDMVGDLKTGHLLGAKPKNQFIAQVFGSIIAAFLTVGLFVLFTTATPCIMYLTESGQCTYGAPSVAAWKAVAEAVTAPNLPVPPTSGYTAIGLAVASLISVVVKHLWIPRKYWVFVPNWNAVGLAFVVPQIQYSSAMAVGSIITWYWLKKWPANYEMYMFAISAGLLAGEGLGGVFQALLAVAGVGGDVYGTSWGCPGNEYCG